jgi:hypothetical protein
VDFAYINGRDDVPITAFVIASFKQLLHLSSVFFRLKLNFDNFIESERFIRIVRIISLKLIQLKIGKNVRFGSDSLQVSLKAS